MNDYTKRLFRMWGAAALTGAIYAEVPYVVWRALGRPYLSSSWAVFALLTCLSFTAAFVYAFRSKLPSDLVIFVVCGFFGVCLANVADATWDSFVNHYDRNLFPLEVAILVIGGAPGTALGLLSGWFAGRAHRRQT